MSARRVVVSLVAILATIALVAAACGSDDVATGHDDDTGSQDQGADDPDSGPDGEDAPGDGPSADGGDDTAFDGAWQLRTGTVDGEPIVVPDGRRVTMTIDGHEIGGVAACNSYGGVITIDDATFTPGEIAWTEMGCEPDVMAAEQAFLTGFLRADIITADGGGITLAGDGVNLRFVELPPPPTAELVDTIWELDTVIDGETASSVMGEPASLELRSDGSLVASTGCRAVTGTWQESGDTIVSPTLSATGECPDELARQDGKVIEVLEGPVQASIDGRRLTLSAAGDIGLSYRAVD